MVAFLKRLNNQSWKVWLGIYAIIAVGGFVTGVGAWHVFSNQAREYRYIDCVENLEPYRTNWWDRSGMVMSPIGHGNDPIWSPLNNIDVSPCIHLWDVKMWHADGSTTNVSPEEINAIAWAKARRARR